MKSREKDNLPKFVKVIADLLGGRPQTWLTIAKTCGVKRHAASQRMKLLEQIPGVRRVRMKADGRTSKLVFEPVEIPGAPVPLAYAACLAASFSWILKGTSYEKHTHDVRSLLLQRAGFEHVNDFERKFLFVTRGGEKALPARERELDAVIKALVTNRIVKFRYRHLDGRVEDVTARPLSFALHGHQFYVLGLRDEEKNPYPFRLSRLGKVTLKGKFQYPDATAYDPEALFRESFGIFVTENHPVQDVILRVSEEVTRLAETHRWFFTQRIEGDTLRMRVRICPEFIAFILSLGERAVVVAPEELRAEIRGKLGSALQGYTARRQPSGPTILAARNVKPLSPSSEQGS